MVAGYPPFFADQPIQIYEKIVSGKVSYFQIQHSPKTGQNLPVNLISTDPTQNWIQPQTDSQPNQNLTRLKFIKFSGPIPGSFFISSERSFA